MSLEQLISNYGYIVILLGVFFEGETVLVAGGFLAHRGYLALPWVVAVAFFATLAADQLFFFLGRSRGAGFLAKRPRWQAKVKKLQTPLNNHRLGIMIGFRFLYGFRTVTPFLLGTSGVPPMQFLIFNAIGAFVWALVVASLGYALGQTLELALEQAKRYELAVLLLIFIAGGALWAIHHYRARRDRSLN